MSKLKVIYQVEKLGKKYSNEEFAKWLSKQYIENNTCDTESNATYAVLLDKVLNDEIGQTRALIKWLKGYAEHLDIYKYVLKVERAEI